jgi:hypothetical protein
MKEIMVFIALVVCTLFMFLAILGLYFPLRKNLMNFFKLMSLFPDDRWKETRSYIIPMNMMSFVFGMFICIIIVFIYEGGF